ALRYSREEVENAAASAGREILLAAIASFLGIAIVAPLALIVVIRRFERDLRTLEAAASHLEDRAQSPPATGSAFDSASATCGPRCAMPTSRWTSCAPSSTPRDNRMTAMLEKNYLW